MTARGKHERELFDFFEKHMPGPEQVQRIAWHLRATGHVMLRTARRMEEGNSMALADMLHDENVQKFILLATVSESISRELVDAVRAIDAEAN